MDPTPSHPAPVVPSYEVPDAAEAFRKFEDAARRMLAVPKKDAEGKPTKGEAEKSHRR